MGTVKLYLGCHLTLCWTFLSGVHRCIAPHEGHIMSFCCIVPMLSTHYNENNPIEYRYIIGFASRPYSCCFPDYNHQNGPATTIGLSQSRFHVPCTQMIMHRVRNTSLYFYLFIHLFTLEVLVRLLSQFYSIFKVTLALLQYPLIWVINSHDSTKYMI